MKQNKPSSRQALAWNYPRARLHKGSNRRASGESRIDHFEMAIGSPEPGEVLAQRFEIQERIAVGGMSLIYRAFDQTRQHAVALKFLSPALLQTPEAVEAFQREAHVSMALNHPNILRVFDVQSYHHTSFLVMELLEGGNLRQWLKQQTRRDPASLLEEKCRILLALCHGLQSAHQITAHCDLKPENIGITAEGEVKIMDFGLARLISRYESQLSRETVTQLNGGTPYYIAPEQLSTQSAGTPLSDQFSFGVIAYELICGELPIGFSQPLVERELLPSRRFNQAIDRCLGSNPGDRFPDIRALQKELELGLRHRPGPWSKFRASWTRKSPLVKWSVSVTVACLALSFPVEYGRRALAQRQGQIEAGWRQFDEQVQTAAILAESAHQRKRTKNILEEKFARQSAIKNLPTTELIALTTLSNDLNKAHLTWDWLSPQLSSQGNFVLLDESIGAMRRALRDNHLDGFVKHRARFDQDLQSLSKAFNTVPQSLNFQYEWERQRTELHQLAMTNVLPSNWRNQAARAQDHFSNKNWIAASEEWRLLLSVTVSNLVAQTLQVEQRYEEEKERWEILFGDLGPPDLRFLSDPHGVANEAVLHKNQSQFTQAIAKFRSATTTLKDWSDEVIRHENALDAAEVPGLKYVRGMGMRFVKPYDNTAYWGVTEVRVMDFARWAAERRGISPITATNWIAPNFVQGPTDPAVWITREDAGSYAGWVNENLIKRFAEKGYAKLHNTVRLLQQDILERYNEESGDVPVRLAIFPDSGEWVSNRFTDIFKDRRIDPNRFLGPTDRGEPSPHGIFGLHNGIWEWTQSYLDFSKGPTRHDRPFKWLLTGGGDFGVADNYGIDPPRTGNYVHVMRKDAVGLRLIFNPGPDVDPNSLP